MVWIPPIVDIVTYFCNTFTNQMRKKERSLVERAQAVPSSKPHKHKTLHAVFICKYTLNSANSQHDNR